MAETHIPETNTPESSIQKGISSSITPVIHVQSENSGFTAGVVLTETNYDVWSQVLEMQIARREKLDYIMGKAPVPEPTDPNYSKWYVENQKVKGWLLASMSPEIMKRYLRLRTAREIWTALAKVFYDGSDESQNFSLNQRAFSTKQKSIKRLRVHIFLNGLDAKFESLRGEILRKDPALDLEETYACVHHAAAHRQTILGETVFSEPFAMWDPTKALRRQNSKSHAAVAKSNSHVSAAAPELAKATSLVVATGNAGKVFNTSTTSGNNTWIIDLGATDHMTFDISGLQSLKPSTQPIVATTNGASAPVIGESSIILTPNLNLHYVLVVPSLKHNLLSVAQITTALNCIVIFGHHLCVFKDIQTQKTIGYGTRKGKLYYLDLIPQSSNLLFVNLNVSDFKCDICELAKSHRVSFPRSMNKSPAPFMVIHSDVWGPANTTFLSGARWFVSFINDHTPERKNRHLLEVVRASLFGAHMPVQYWGKAATAAAYLINLVPSSSLQFQTPFHVLHTAIRAPIVSNLYPRIFGCVAYVHLPQSLRNKLEPRDIRCVFIGYASHQKGYRCYRPPS
ncbi:uncharacterized protein LOC111391338 [Olea europaea var. sylvestris]|uniref:uncharacterized protein LOC111391338 n=1 Tax=Olea europaea var. sylvestris TaxID=158386 RepID=UPI000C1D8756|nr:uncharacterized protein LOC111391338 [Olea europaea var. sylvestris]